MLDQPQPLEGQPAEPTQSPAQPAPKRWPWLRIGLLGLLGVAAIAGAWWWQKLDPASRVTPVPTPGAADLPKPVAVQLQPWVSGLVVPWELVFTSETRAIVAERPGRLRVIENGKLQDTPLAQLPDVSSVSEEGLMGLVLDPGYASNKLMYACYAYKTGSTYTDKIVRFEDRGTSIGPLTTLLDGIPAAPNHAGCRLSVGPVDGKLYISTGDASKRERVQDPGYLGGKILRINLDGSIPTDNPTAGSPVWTTGHRNPQGLAWQPGSNLLFATEHGPSGWDGEPGGDEVNAIIKGKNYGWPLVSHTKTDPRFESPLQVYTPPIAPGGATFYTGSALPQFKNKLLMAALKDQGVYVLSFDNHSRTKVTSSVKLDDVKVGRIREIVQGPDGAVYLLTSNRDANGKPGAGDDFIYRLSAK